MKADTKTITNFHVEELDHKLILPKITVIEMKTNYRLYYTSRVSRETKELRVEFPQIEVALSMMEWRKGMLIQDAFPYLSAEEREFIAGFTPIEQEGILR